MKIPNKGCLLETFAIHDGKTQRMPYHERRIFASCHTLGWMPPPMDDFIRALSDTPHDGLYRCSITYQSGQIISTTHTEYQPRLIRRLRPIIISENFYRLKWADRSCFSPFITTPDTEPLFLLDGMITDTTYTNILLEDHEGKLYTPARPLLQGTQRDFLIEQGLITPQDIPLQTIMQYSKIHLINAMLPVGKVVIDLTKDTILDTERAY